MMSEFNEKVLELSYDVEHYERCGIQDWRNDIEIEKYENYESHLFYRPNEFEHPTPIIYQGYKPVVEHIDYPEADNSWNVMSKRMYEVLLSIGDFPHRVIPVVIVDSREQKENWFDSSSNLRKEICLWNYLVIQMTEHLDVFDLQKSIYTVDAEDGFVDRIDEYVFKVPLNGFPPIFKIPEDRTNTFVSSEAREAMNKAKITGPRFISLQQAKDWVDNPIVLPDKVYV